MNWFKKFFIKPKTLKELAEKTKGDIKLLASWIDYFIDYENEPNGTDIWQPADVVFLRRKGDCEDISGLFSTVIKMWGLEFDPFVLAAFHKGGGHAVCVFKEDGVYKHYSTTGFVVMPKGKITLDIAGSIYRDWNIMELYDIEGKLLNTIERENF